MAYTATHAETGTFSQVLARIGNAIAAWGSYAAERRLEPLRNEIKALHAMSDAELEANGLTRDDIEIRVFSRYFYC